MINGVLNVENKIDGVLNVENNFFIRKKLIYL